MPWTTDDVDEHKKGLDAKMTALWLRVANPTRDECMDEGNDEKECDATAIRNANAVVNRAMKENEIAEIARSALEVALAITNDTGEIGTDTAKHLLDNLCGEFNEYVQAAKTEPQEDPKEPGGVGLDTDLADALAQIASGKGKTDQGALVKLQSLGLVTETGGLY